MAKVRRLRITRAPILKYNIKQEYIQMGLGHLESNSNFNLRVAVEARDEAARCIDIESDSCEGTDVQFIASDDRRT